MDALEAAVDQAVAQGGEMEAALEQAKKQRAEMRRLAKQLDHSLHLLAAEA